MGTKNGYQMLIMGCVWCNLLSSLYFTQSHARDKSIIRWVLGLMGDVSPVDTLTFNVSGKTVIIRGCTWIETHRCVLGLSSLVPNVRTPSRIGACIIGTPKTTQQQACIHSFSTEWYRPDISLMIWPPLVVVGYTIRHSVSCTSEMHNEETVLPPVPPPTLQRRCPFCPFVTATSLAGSAQVRLIKLPSPWNFKASVIHLHAC